MGNTGFMSYFPGDKVRIKTWNDMKTEFKKDYRYPYIRVKPYYYLEFEETIKKINPNRIFTIKTVNLRVQQPSFYRMKEIGFKWADYMIECLAKDYVEPIPIKDRWEIMDL